MRQAAILGLTSDNGTDIFGKVLLADRRGRCAQRLDVFQNSRRGNGVCRAICAKKDQARNKCYKSVQGLPPSVWRSLYDQKRQKGVVLSSLS